MAADPPETTYAVLGLIDKVPASSGHELAAVADRSFTHFWPISRTLLYRELTRLVELGWATATRVEQVRNPSKWIYHVTADGQQALAGWLGHPVPVISSYRSSVLLRLFFGTRMSPSQLRALLEDYRRAAGPARGVRCHRQHACAAVDSDGANGAPQRSARSSHGRGQAGLDRRGPGRTRARGLGIR